MKINSFKILYSTTIPIQSYGVNDKIAVEMDVTPDDSFNLKETVKKHKADISEIVNEIYPGRIIQINHEVLQSPPEWAKDFHQVTTSSRNVGRVFIGIPTEKDIQSCKSLKDLEEVYFPAIDVIKDEELKRKLWIVHDEVFNSLSNRPK